MWFKEKDGNFFFDFGEYDTGDVLEWKPHMKKPDSFWEPCKEIDVKIIKNAEKIDKYNVDYDGFLQTLGIL